MKAINPVNSHANYVKYVKYVKYAVATIALLVILVMGYIIVTNLINTKGSDCTTVDTIDASLTVYTPPGGLAMIGFNTDKDSLKFGVVSPGVTPLRKVNAQYSRDAQVSIIMTGQLAPWTQIEPSEFDLLANQSQEVQFRVYVPSSAAEGNYTGKALFCFKEK